MKSQKKSFFFRWIPRLVQSALCILVISVMGIAYSYLMPKWVSRGKLYDRVEDVPFHQIALVFGTSDRHLGRENRYFRYRMEATTALWKAGKIRTIIVSGDNRSRYYNEPQKMRSALIQNGIPKEQIVCDFAGLRTLDSVVRAQKIFGANEILFISQRFQNERAMYLANSSNFSASGYNAQDLPLKSGIKTQIREIGARVKMWLDIHILKTEPRFLGDKIHIPNQSISPASP